MLLLLLVLVVVLLIFLTVITIAIVGFHQTAFLSPFPQKRHRHEHRVKVIAGCKQLHFTAQIFPALTKSNCISHTIAVAQLNKMVMVVMLLTKAVSTKFHSNASTIACKVRTNERELEMVKRPPTEQEQEQMHKSNQTKNPMYSFPAFGVYILCILSILYRQAAVLPECFVRPTIVLLNCGSKAAFIARIDSIKFI